MPEPFAHALGDHGAVSRRNGSAHRHHSATFDEVAGPYRETAFGPMAVWELGLSRDALVLGNRQHLSEADQQRAESCGVEVVSRRSGGGAVYLCATTSLWVDLWFPARSDRAPADLSQLFVGVGQAWARGLDSLGFRTQVHERPASQDAVRKRLASRVCFGDLGWGEVTVAGSKVVGLAQRRVRDGVRVQCVAEWSGGGRRVLDFVETTPEERAVVETLTAPVGIAAGATGSARSVADPLIEALTESLFSL